MLSPQEVQVIVERLCNALVPLFPQDKMDAIIFGSYARGNAEPDSDLDVMILVDSPREAITQRNWQVGEIAADLLMDYGTVVSPIVENREYFQSYVDLLPFFRNVSHEGVKLRG